MCDKERLNKKIKGGYEFYMEYREINDEIWDYDIDTILFFVKFAEAYLDFVLSGLTDDELKQEIKHFQNHLFLKKILKIQMQFVKVYHKDKIENLTDGKIDNKYPLNEKSDFNEGAKWLKQKLLEQITDDSDNPSMKSFKKLVRRLQKL